MPTTVARLSSNGVYLTNSYFDEVTTTINSINLNAIYSGGFDEVTIQGAGGGLVKRETNNNLLVSGYFDEITGLSNSNFLGTIVTNNATLSATSPFGSQYNSYRFTGASQTSYLTLANNNNFAVGTNDFTIEWWQYETDSNSYPRAFSIGSYPSASLAFSLEGNYIMWVGGANVISTPTPIKPRLSWVHYAMVRKGTSLTLYINGTSVQTFTNSTNITNGTTVLTLGGDTGAGNQMFGGYIYGFRFVNGLAVYTGNFTVPTGPLTQTAPANPYGGSNTSAINREQCTLLLNP